MKNLMTALAVGVVMAASAVEEMPCKSWDDIGTNLSLPEEIAGMRMRTRGEYGKDDQSFMYVSREFVEETPGQRVLTIYIYRRDWAKLEADGVCANVRRELADVIEAVRHRPDGGVLGVEVLDKAKPGKIGATDSLTAEFAYKDGEHGSDMRGYALLCSFAGWFFKLRYSECVTDAAGKNRSSSWQKVVDEVGALMDRAKQSRATDVYSVADATNRLAAIRRKWTGADNRVPMWKMPNFGEKFLEIDRLQEWCGEKPEERYPDFERAARDAIDLRFEPAVWYYNLACALAVQGKKDASFEALEQAVAAGYGTTGGTKHVREDSDLFSLTNDARFAALCSAMDADNRPRVDGPRQLAVEKGGFVRLSEENVYFSLKDASYLVNLRTDHECPVVYVNHHENHPDIPCEGLINVIYPKEAHKERRDIAYSNIHFLDFDRLSPQSGASFFPAVVASSWDYGDDRLNGSTSIPAGYGLSEPNARSELQHCYTWNVLGVYSASADYWTDGIDRFLGWFPGCIAYAGGPEEADKFVVLFRDIVRALPKKCRDDAALLALNLIRHGQKCVKTEADFMSGKAQRPVLRFADIDVKKVLASAAGMTPDAAIPFTPFLDPEKTLALSKLAVTDFRGWPYAADCACHTKSLYHAAFFARGGEHTFRYAAACYPVKDGKLVWKLLQGDEKKVRVLPKTEDGSEVELEVDYHTAFDVTLADGTKHKTSRVDLGCFLVNSNGVASVPAIVSVCFLPNETREYDKDGKLVSIDYTKRQIEGYCPNLCPKGDWKDSFHWNEDGQLLGWTRTCMDERGRISTNEFTREGLVVYARDALGRPKNAHRSLRSEWMQWLTPTNMTDEMKLQYAVSFGQHYDNSDGDMDQTSLVWRYEYENDTDRFGKPSKSKPKPFSYRPELCRRADFSGSGFRLPLMDQIMFGYNIYNGYKHDSLDENAGDMMREDCSVALQAIGLTPPKTLKKMVFCPWEPSSNDVWKVEVGDLEKTLAVGLWELADGSYRFCGPLVKGESETRLSVGATMRKLNTVGEFAAYAELDKLYRRCDRNEALKMFADHLPKESLSATYVVEGDFVSLNELPDGMENTLVAWRLTERYYFGVFAYLGDGRNIRQYVFREINRKTGEIGTLALLNELPSRAIGNTILSAGIGNPVACNNLAVLMYAGIVNPYCYDEDTATEYLEYPAREGNATAAYNLGVMAENRGEKSAAARRYAEAKALQKK